VVLQPRRWSNGRREGLHLSQLGQDHWENWEESISPAHKADAGKKRSGNASFTCFGHGAIKCLLVPGDAGDLCKSKISAWQGRLLLWDEKCHRRVGSAAKRCRAWRPTCKRCRHRRHHCRRISREARCRNGRDGRNTHTHTGHTPAPLSCLPGSRFPRNATTAAA
jgi:hypothetical protein